MATMPRLDKAAVASAAAARVEAVARAHAGATVDYLRAIAELANAEAAAANELRPLRDQIALSLALYDGLRTLHNTVGVNRTCFYEMRCDALQLSPVERKAKWLERQPDEDSTQRLHRIAARASARGVRHYPHSLARLVDISGQVALADAISALARTRRDELVPVLRDAGWTRQRLADLIGLSPTRVTRIAAKSNAA